MPRRAVARPEPDGTSLVTLVRNYKALTDNVELLEERRRSIRDQLSSIVEQDGEVDEKGHIVLALPSKVEGIARLVRQRRVKRTLDEHVAERILTKAHLVERCYKNVPVLDEDAVMQALFEGDLTEEDVDRMFPTKVTWAFVPLKD